MKKLVLLALAGSCGLAVWGQTNSPAPAASERKVGLRADQFFFSGTASRQLIYTGNVCVTNAQGTLTCERLTIDLPPESSVDSRPTNVVAETNVVINFLKDGDTNHISCDKMVNDYSVVDSVTNDMFWFYGHAKMSNSKGSATGEPLYYNNVNGQFGGTNFESQIALPSSAGSGTNASTNGVVSPFNVFK